MHFNRHDVLIFDRAVVGYGFSDAPMTHSADSGGTAARTFGPLQVASSRDGAVLDDHQLPGSRAGASCYVVASRR